jgi:signal transduction histidine kinase
LRLIIKDDGHGFDLEHDGSRAAGHYGLIGMRERANLMGADFNLESWPRCGTSISVVLPLIKERESLSRLKEESTW